MRKQVTRVGERGEQGRRDRAPCPAAAAPWPPTLSSDAQASAARPLLGPEPPLAQATAAPLLRRRRLRQRRRSSQRRCAASAGFGASPARALAPSPLLCRSAAPRSPPPPLRQPPRAVSTRERSGPSTLSSARNPATGAITTCEQSKHKPRDCSDATSQDSNARSITRSSTPHQKKLRTRLGRVVRVVPPKPQLLPQRELPQPPQEHLLVLRQSLDLVPQVLPVGCGGGEAAALLLCRVRCQLLRARRTQGTWYGSEPVTSSNSSRAVRLMR